MSKLALSRRHFVFGALGTAAAAVAAQASRLVGAAPASRTAFPPPPLDPHAEHVVGAVGTVDHLRNGFDPATVLKQFNTGDRVTEENGRTVREYTIVAIDKEI